MSTAILDDSFSDIQFSDEKVSQHEKRERTRSLLALSFLWAYIGVIVLLICVIAWEDQVTMAVAKDFLLALGGPLGFVIGFYFKSESER